MSRRPDWWLRKWNETVGGSRAAKIMGASKHGDPATEYDFAVGDRPLPNLDNDPNVRRGIILEPIARTLLKEAGFEIRCHHPFQFIFNQKYPWAHTLTDGSARADGESEWSDLEIKWPRPAKVEQVRLNGLSPDYMCQAQHEMAVTGKKKLYFAVCSCVTLDVILVPVEIDEAFVASMMEVERNWMEHVRARQRPNVEMEESKLIEIPQTSGEMVVVSSPEALDAARAYLEAKTLADEADELLGASRDRLFGFMEDNGTCCEVREGDTPLVRCHRISVSGARRFDAARCVQEHPDMAVYYTTGKAYEQQRVYPMLKTGGMY